MEFKTTKAKKILNSILSLYLRTLSRGKPLKFFFEYLIYIYICQKHQCVSSAKFGTDRCMRFHLLYVVVKCQYHCSNHFVQRSFFLFILCVSDHIFVCTIPFAIGYIYISTTKCKIQHKVTCTTYILIRCIFFVKSQHS